MGLQSPLRIVFSTNKRTKSLDNLRSPLSHLVEVSLLALVSLSEYFVVKKTSWSAICILSVFPFLVLIHHNLAFLNFFYLNGESSKFLKLLNLLLLLLLQLPTQVQNILPLLLSDLLFCFLRVVVQFCKHLLLL